MALRLRVLCPGLCGGVGEGRRGRRGQVEELVGGNTGIVGGHTGLEKPTGLDRGRSRRRVGRRRRGHWVGIKRNVPGKVRHGRRYRRQKRRVVGEDLVETEGHGCRI